jgi:hypothetical protein
MRIAAVALAVVLSLVAGGCKDKPNDEDCVKACAHGNELAKRYFEEHPEKVPAPSPATENQASTSAAPRGSQAWDDQEAALCKQNCQNSGTASATECILKATEYEAMQKCGG